MVKAAWAPTPEPQRTAPPSSPSDPPTSPPDLIFFPSSSHSSPCAHITLLHAQSSLSTEIFVPGMRRTALLTTLLQTELDSGDISMPIQVMARWQMPQHLLVPSTWEMKRGSAGPDHRALVQHPHRQPGQKGTMHTPTPTCVAPLLTWDEILLLGCKKKSTSAL